MVNQFDVLLLILGIVLGIFITSFINAMKAPAAAIEDQTEWESVESEGEEEDEQLSTDLSRMESAAYNQTMLEKYPLEDIKLVLCVRHDLQMGKGKIGAQCGHATMGAYKQVKRWAKTSSYWRKVVEKWNYEGTKKICVKVGSEAEM